jgi:hypothetical protein
MSLRVNFLSVRHVLASAHLPGGALAGAVSRVRMSVLVGASNCQIFANGLDLVALRPEAYG